jgi:NAD(P)-dependent dehydrogenase (short-subunit alcohol dehydrogenase family)
MANHSDTHRVWFITGTSQGFGRELVRASLQRGDSVMATSRNPQAVAAAFSAAADRLLAVSMDLRNSAQISSVVDQAIKRFGRIDILVNNAGYGVTGAVEEASDSEIASIYETNVFGLLRVTRAVLPYLRKQRSGHIVNISSIGGLTGMPGWGIYNSTKFAVEGLSEALAAELAPLGIGVTIVEPGPFRTDFLGGSLEKAAKVFFRTTKLLPVRREQVLRSAMENSPATPPSPRTPLFRRLRRRFRRCICCWAGLRTTAPIKSSMRFAAKWNLGAN